MNKYTSIREQFCPNKHCQYFEKFLENNIGVHSKKNNRFICKNCKRTWVGHKNQLYYRLRAPREKIDLAKILYGEGRSVREIAKKAKVSPSTIQRWKAFFELFY